MNIDDRCLRILNSGSDKEACSVLLELTTKHAQTFSFPDLKLEAKQEFIASLQKRLENDQSSTQCHILALQMLRLFSREKDKLVTMTTEYSLGLIMKMAGLKHYAEQTNPECVTIQDGGNQDVVVEAQKCLCNLIFNSTQAQRICSKNGCVEGTIQRLKTYKDPALKFEIKFFDMRMLFLLTALCSDTRPKIRYELHGFTYLMEVVDLTLRDAESRNTGLVDQEVDLICEILKILFNLTVTVDKNTLDEEEEAHFMRLVSVLRDLLMVKTLSKDRQEELTSHTVNLLTNIPRDCYEELLIPLNEMDIEGMENKEVEYDGRNMEAIILLLNFLFSRLDRPYKSLKESLTPILHCLCEMCRANRSIRKFCRVRVLPPLKDEVKKLPEEGESFRNRLCKLLTSPITEVKDLVADFLFVMCKESVQRMVKYTGYGNCAGLLANRGLLLGGKSDGNYSSNSDDSETEEYSTLKQSVNPVTGRYETEKSNPFEGMSDEQKEYEAMKLVNAMDKLQRGGIIQPSVVGPDGRPQPVEHILELTENMNIEDQTEETSQD
ncbi:chaperone Ric-8A-like [Mytilus edulis]|uniref:Synembryn-A n=1 Tax=Mytilus edulis TaxID=6550 RepID=A0A8S3TNJ0_MYTED|nr:Synembryn-A [Mytilus edulis]